MRKKIAVTGGIGSGKSTVMAYLKSLGYPCFSCDEIYGEIIKSPNYIQKVEQAFPKCVENGGINRQLLSACVFADERELEKLNGIAHPMIMERLRGEMNEERSPVRFAEVPLLFEGNYQEEFDEVWVVLREEAQRVHALEKRDGSTRPVIEEKMRRQFNYATPQAKELFEKINAKQFWNNGSEEELKKQIDQALLQIK